MSWLYLSITFDSFWLKRKFVLFVVVLYYFVSVLYCFAFILFCAELILHFVRFYSINYVVCRCYCALYRLYYFFLCWYLMFVVCLYSVNNNNVFNHYKIMLMYFHIV